jgi:hypothetical protein
LARLREDLGQPRSVGRIAAGDHLRPPRAFDEHQGLEHLRIDPGAPRDAVDQRPECRHTGGGRQRPARAHHKQRLPVAGRRAGDVLGRVRRPVSERVAGGGARRDTRGGWLWQRAAADARDQQRDDGQRRACDHAQSRATPRPDGHVLYVRPRQRAACVAFVQSLGKNCQP